MRASIASLHVVVLAVSLLLHHAFASDASEALLNAPLPASAHAAVVVLDMRQNGVLMSISTFRSHNSVDETLAFYRSLWPARKDDPGHVENTVGDWQIISRLNGDVNLVLQLQPNDENGSEGLFSAVQVNDISVATETIELPPGGAVLSSTEKVELGRIAKTWVIRSTSGAGHAAAFYSDVFVRKGWRLISDRTVDGLHVSRFNQSIGTLELVIGQADDGSTMSILNRVSEDD